MTTPTDGPPADSHEGLVYRDYLIGLEATVGRLEHELAGSPESGAAPRPDLVQTVAGLRAEVASLNESVRESRRLLTKVVSAAKVSAGDLLPEDGDGDLARIAALERELVALRASPSMRIGRAVTAPFRLARGKLR